MKSKLMIIGIVILLILTNTMAVYATSETTVTLEANKTQVKVEEEFTVTIKATCPDGINGVVTKYTYDADKLEYVSEAVADSNYSFGGNKAEKEIFVYCTSTDSIQTANVYSLTFKVKNGIQVGSTAKVGITQTTLDSDAATNSEHLIDAQEITVTVIEEEQNPPTGGEEQNPPTGGEEQDPPTGEEEQDPPTGEEECDHTYIIKKNSSQHWKECSKCNEKEEGSTQAHSFGNYTDKRTGKHSAICTVCEYEIMEDHEYENDICKDCKAVKPQENDEEECEHSFGNYKDNNDGTHTGTCSKCGEEQKEEHTYENSVCTDCKSEHSVKNCKHDNGSVSVVDNKDGTHSNVCEVCGEKFNTEKHTYENGTCIKCKVKQPTTPGTTGGDDKKDETTAQKEIPKAGLNTMLTIGIIFIAILAIIMYTKNKKYQDIK